MSTTPFDFANRCCFCGADNSHQARGYGGERLCDCGKGGYGEPDEPTMAYKGNLPSTAPEPPPLPTHP